MEIKLKTVNMDGSTHELEQPPRRRTKLAYRTHEGRSRLPPATENKFESGGACTPHGDFRRPGRNTPALTLGEQS
jgi:hypothetical protein